MNDRFAPRRFALRNSNVRFGRRPGRKARVETCEPRQMLSGVPVLNSLPGAPASILLDFTGHTIQSFPIPGDNPGYMTVTIPAFDSDDDPNNFGPSELEQMFEMWKQVAEDYSIFNINVTTDEAAFANNPEWFHTPVAQRVVVGGKAYDIDHTWGILVNPSGTTMLDAFNDKDQENVSLVFDRHTPGWDIEEGAPVVEKLPFYVISEVASHEPGHAFGLAHQHEWDDSTGQFITEYGVGDILRAPIMGQAYYTMRGLWSVTPDNAQLDGKYSFQDDTALIASHNFFGYRPDEPGNTAATAIDLGVAGDKQKALVQSGVINRYDDGGVNADVDYFKAVVPPPIPFLGSWNVRVTTVDEAANLDAKLRVFNGKQSLLATSDPTLTFDFATLNAELSLPLQKAPVPGDEYFFQVSSHGGFGDWGQYSFSLDFNSTFRVKDIRLISLPPLIDRICDPAGPYPPWAHDTMVQLAKVVIMQDESLDGLSAMRDGRLLIDDARWREELFNRTAATLDRALEGHVRDRLDFETFNQALEALWNNAEVEVPAVYDWATLAEQGRSAGEMRLAGKSAPETSSLKSGQDGIAMLFVSPGAALPTLARARLGAAPLGGNAVEAVLDLPVEEIATLAKSRLNAAHAKADASDAESALWGLALDAEFDVLA